MTEEINFIQSNFYCGVFFITEAQDEPRKRLRSMLLELDVMGDHILVAAPGNIHVETYETKTKVADFINRRLNQNYTRSRFVKHYALDEAATTTEIVEAFGIYAPFDEPFDVKGVGYAGAIEHPR